MQRLDEIVARMLGDLRHRVVREQDGAPENDDRPADRMKAAKFVRIAQELNDAERKRRNRRRRRRVAS